jgi:hypothetical protein
MTFHNDPCCAFDTSCIISVDLPFASSRPDPPAFVKEDSGESCLIGELVGMSHRAHGMALRLSISPNLHLTRDMMGPD